MNTKSILTAALTRGLRRSVGAASIASLLLTSSCATSMPMFARHKGRKPDAEKLTDAATGKAIPSYADRLDAAKQAQTAKSDPSTGVEQAVVKEQHLASNIQPLSYEMQEKDSPAPVATASTDRPWAPDLNGKPTVPPLNDAAIAAGLMPVNGACPTYCPPCTTGSVATVECGKPRSFPTENGADEYVCDGGDKHLPVHYHEGRMAGLDIEDTVAEFRDSDGNKRVKPSNTVCVYAPRFGVARAVSDAVEKFAVNRPAGTQEEIKPVGYTARAVVDQKRDVDTAVGMRTNDRLSAVRVQQADGELENDVKAAHHAKLINPFEDYGFVQDGLCRAAERNNLINAAKSAIEWSKGQAPKAVAKDENGTEIIALFDAMELIGSKDMRTPGELRIVKLADKKTAKLGDVVSFTIRFDNLGGKELFEIRILDNLSPRLQLLDETVACDLPGELDITDNGAGGEVLTFKLSEALKGNTGGALTFQCKVR